MSHKNTTPAISAKAQNLVIKSTNDQKNDNTNTTNKCGNLRTFPYPVCWADDERMDALLAPFRLRTVNPVHYDNKMKFWQDLIEEYCMHKGDAHFSKRELQLMFTRGMRMPRCLDIVVQDMLNKRKIRRHVEYAYDPLNTWSGWAINSFLKKPITWGFHKLKVSVGWTDGIEEDAICEYVHLDVIKQFCRELEENVLSKYLGRILHCDVIRKATAESRVLSEKCLHMCLYTLFCQNKIGLTYKTDTQTQQIHLIKIPAKATDTTDITDADLAVHNLEMTQTDLLNQLEEIAGEIKLNVAKARLHLQNNNRQLAKTYMRKKQLLEKNHEKRSIALHNIEVLLNNVHETQSNGEILDAYKIGSKALQNVLNESGLNYDNVSEVINEMRENIENHNEVQDTIANANLNDVTMGAEYDNDELEQELREIMGEVTPNRATNKPTLPAVVAAATTPKTPTPSTKAPKTTTTTTGIAQPISKITKMRTFDFGGISATSTPDANAIKPTVTITDEDLLAMLDDLEALEVESLRGDNDATEEKDNNHKGSKMSSF